MSRVVCAALLALLPGQALAYELLGFKWADEQIPVGYWISDYVEDSLPEGYTIDAILMGYDAWLDAECSGFRGEFLGTMAENIPNNPNDLRNTVTWDDPGNRIPAGVLAVTYTNWSRTEVAGKIDGRIVMRALDSDIVFNDNVMWATEEQIADGECFRQTSVVAVATHEIGHLTGLGHTCEATDACVRTEDREATMYWAAGPCDSNSSTIAIEDIRGAHALYGPGAFEVVCSHELDPTSADTIAVGLVPFELKCVAVASDPSDSGTFEWYWGDGGRVDGDRVTHTYTEPGNFSVQVCQEGVSDLCGDWKNCKNKTSYVRACAVPEPEFTLAHVDGLRYAMLNETDVSVYGCIYDIVWHVFSPSGELEVELKAWEPEYTFQEEGTYRIVLNVGGPAGTGAAELSVNVRNRRGAAYGCSTIGGGLAPFGLMVLFGLGGVTVRRRR